MLADFISKHADEILISDKILQFGGRVEFPNCDNSLVNDRLRVRRIDCQLDPRQLARLMDEFNALT